MSWNAKINEEYEKMMQEKSLVLKKTQEDAKIVFCPILDKLLIDHEKGEFIKSGFTWMSPDFVYIDLEHDYKTTQGLHGEYTAVTAKVTVRSKDGKKRKSFLIFKTKNLSSEVVFELYDIIWKIQKHRNLTFRTPNKF